METLTLTGYNEDEREINVVSNQTNMLVNMFDRTGTRRVRKKTNLTQSYKRGDVVERHNRLRTERTRRNEEREKNADR